MDRPYVSLANLETFWTAAKQYIDNQSSGVSPELEQMVQTLTNKLNGEITTRSEADIEINRLISAINEYTINGTKISSNPILNGDDIPYSSDTDNVSVHDKVNSIDQEVSGIKSGYVKSVKGEGVNVSVTPTTSSNGDVTIKVDATSLKNRMDAIDGYTVNSKQISSNPTLTGNDITLGVSVGDDTNYPQTKTLTASIQKLREETSSVKEYTVNGEKISTNPVLNGDNIPYSSDNDTTSVHDKVNSIDQSVNGIKNYTVNSKTISTNPTLNGGDIPYSSSDSTSLYSKINSMSQDVTTIKNSYVKSIKGEGVGVTVTPTTSSTGDVTIKVDASEIGNMIGAVGQFMQVKGVLTSLPSNTTGYQNGDVIIVGNKEYLCYESAWHLLGDVTQLSQDVSTIKNSYVKTIKGEGVGVTVTPTTSSNGDVTIKVDATTLNQNLNNYVLKTGDTITQTAYDNGLILNRNTANAGAGIVVKSQGTTLGSFGVNGDKEFEYITGGASKFVVAQNGVCSAVDFSTTSDERLKEYVSDVEVDFEKLKSIPKVYYHWKDSAMGEDLQIGTYAQKLKEIYPECVNYDANKDKYSVNYQKLVVVALKAVDCLHDRVERLEKIIESLVK